jgi:RNA polymerase sigma factor (sigma-70 family)
MDALANPHELIRRVYAYAAYRIGPGPDAEDVTSETFARALRYRDSFDERRGEPLSWLIGIARRCIADLVEEQPSSTTDEQQSEADPADRIAMRVDLSAAVSKLPVRDRELIALRYGGDLSASQIASILELTTNAVEVALHRALNRVRAVVVMQPAANDTGADRPLRQVLNSRFDQV